MNIIVLNTKVLIQVSIFTSADPPPTHPPTLYMVIRATRRSSWFPGKGNTFIYQLFQDPLKGSSPRNPTNELSLWRQEIYRKILKISPSIYV